MEFRLFGPLQVIDDDGAPVSLASPTERALLAVLLLEAGRVVSADGLIESGWPGRGEGVSRSTLRYHVSKLRDALEGASRLGRELVVTSGPGYCLQADPETIDIRRFEDLVRRGRRHLEEDPAEARRLLGEALDLAAGAPLAGFTYHEFAAAEIRRLEDLLLSAQEDRIAADLALGRHRDVVDELQGLVVSHPLRERFWAHLMMALYRCGRQAEALRAYRAAQRALGEELGIDTSEELRRLEEQVLLRDPALIETVPAAEGRRSLPVRLTSFVGRVREIATLTGLVGEHRLVTVLGPPGAGKTRLAIEVADRLGADFEWVWFVDLARQANRPGILEALAQSIGVARRERLVDDRTAEEGLRGFLQRKRALLLLDNCEPVAEEAGAVVGELLRSCPLLKVLATSRQALGVEGEAVWNIPMLTATTEGDGAAMSDACELFVSRARSADAASQIHEDDAPRMARICRLLDGLPLAIELAAAQLDVLSLEQVEQRLQREVAPESSSDPGLLGQERLWSAIGWSYERLSPAEARLFERLSVCAGGFSLPLAEALAAPEPDPVGLLAGLVRRSLVAAERADGSLRYRMLETLRWFGGKRLRESKVADDARPAHAAFLTGRAEEAWQEWLHWEQPSALGRQDLDNLRTALDWLEGHDPPGFAQLAGALGWLWADYFLPGEGWEWTNRALRVQGLPAAHRARVGLAVALTAWTAEQGAAAVALSEEVLSYFRRAGAQHTVVRALIQYGGLCEWFTLAGHAEARVEAVEIARTLGDDRTLAGCLDSRAWADFASSDPACIDRWREAEDAYRRCGDDEGWALAAAARLAAEVTWGRSSSGDAPAELERIRRMVSGRRVSWSAAMVENQLRGVHEMTGDLSGALAHGRRAVQGFEEVGDEDWRALCLGDLGCLHRMMGDFQEAGRCLLEATAYFRRIGRFGSSVWLLESLAELLVAAGEPEIGAGLLGTAEQLRAEADLPLPRWDRPDFDEAIERLGQQLGVQRLRRLMAAGRSASLDQALDLAEQRVGRLVLGGTPGGSATPPVQGRRGGGLPVSTR